MPAIRILECAFLVPLRRDTELSDGGKHKPPLWRWLDDQLQDSFGAGTIAPGKYEGFYTDPDTGKRIDDRCYKYIVALREDRIDQLRDILREVCERFSQKCVYLSVAGEVEFVRRA